jgi:gliding motility-associated-like protein
LGCPSKVTTIIVSKEKNIQIDITKSIESCPGKCDASAKAIVTNPASPLTFIWSNGMSTQEIKGLCEGKYAVTIIDNDGCPGMGEVVIESNPAQFTISVTTTKSSCDKAADGTATITSPIGAGYTYEWSNGQKGITATGLKPGSYSVVVKDITGCTNKKDDIVISPNPSPVKIDIPARDSIVNGQTKTVIVKTSPTGTMTFQWSPSTGVKDKGNSTFDFSPTTDTKYTVTATDVNGCSATAMMFIKVSQVKFPSIFSPNAQDGNALFQPTFIPDGVKVTNLIIFDRWGSLVYSYNDQKAWWNGKLKNDGEELASDVYVYYLEYTIDGKAVPAQKGDITLIR